MVGKNKKEWTPKDEMKPMDESGASVSSFGKLVAWILAFFDGQHGLCSGTEPKTLFHLSIRHQFSTGAWSFRLPIFSFFPSQLPTQDADSQSTSFSPEDQFDSVRYQA
ncbi:hypothetical protein TNCV_4043991 [Trichonephila clavipes]|nr:hypothetical protein TNCV_4043991 [Trichonephila clavipes]